MSPQRGLFLDPEPDRVPYVKADSVEDSLCNVGDIGTPRDAKRDEEPKVTPRKNLRAPVAGLWLARYHTLALRNAGLSSLRRPGPR
jgi:hypothetical protein